MRNFANLTLVMLVLSILACACSNSSQKRNEANKTENNANSTEQANKQCDLKIDQSPEVKGFRLGMTADDVKKKVPQFKEKKPDEVGSYEIFFVNPKPNDQVPQGIKLPSLDSLIVRLEFFKGRVISVTSFTYPNPSGINLETYVDRVPESLKIPYKLVDENKNDDEDPALICDGFRVKAGSGYLKYEENWLPTTYWYHLVEESKAIDTLAEQRKQLKIKKDKMQKDSREQRANTYRP